MVDHYIAEIRKELNSLVIQENAELHQGEILILSQKLDKLIFVKQTLLMNRVQSNYRKQLQSLLCPTLYALVTAYE